GRAAVQPTVSCRKGFDGAPSHTRKPGRHEDRASIPKRSQDPRDYAIDARARHVPRMALRYRGYGCRGTPHEVGLSEPHVRTGRARTLRAGLSSKYIPALRALILIRAPGTRDDIRLGVLRVGGTPVVHTGQLQMAMGEGTLVCGIRD